MGCADPVEAHEQCGGYAWTGSTCCEEGYECVVMGKGTCYSEVGDDETERELARSPLVVYMYYCIV